MGKFYLFGFGIFIFSIWIFNTYVPSNFWGNNYFLTVAIVIIYIGIFFGSLISLLDEYFPNSKITKFIKNLYEQILSGL